jgi:hypothetical protein
MSGPVIGDPVVSCCILLSVFHGTFVVTMERYPTNSALPVQQRLAGIKLKNLRLRNPERKSRGWQGNSIGSDQFTSYPEYFPHEKIKVAIPAAMIGNGDM